MMTNICPRTPSARPPPGRKDAPTASLEALRAEIVERRRAEEQVRMLKDQLADAILARQRAEEALQVRRNVSTR